MVGVCVGRRVGALLGFGDGATVSGVGAPLGSEVSVVGPPLERPADGNGLGASDCAALATLLTRGPPRSVTAPTPAGTPLRVSAVRATWAVASARQTKATWA